MSHESNTTVPSSGDEAQRLANAAFWITVMGIIAFSGAVYTFVL